jgi:hypothetical protein
LWHLAGFASGHADAYNYPGVVGARLAARRRGALTYARR